jgi:hypothetical protein
MRVPQSNASTKPTKMKKKKKASSILKFLLFLVLRFLLYCVDEKLNGACGVDGRNKRETERERE